MNNNEIQFDLTTDHLHKEIDLIQACITRMANNSFMCKGWLLSILIAILALLPENINRINICYLIAAVDLCFWWLDSFYLLQERLYRWKYEWVIKNRPYNRDFLYDLNPYNKDMWIYEYTPKNRNCIVRILRITARKITDFITGKPEKRPYMIEIMLSKTLLPMYGSCFIVSILLIIFKYQ